MDGDDDVDGGGEFSTYDDEPFVDYPEDEVEVSNVYKPTKGIFSSGSYNGLVCVNVWLSSLNNTYISEN